MRNGIVLLLGLIGIANASPITIPDVPAYSWYHGCGPTAVASVFGYWDQHGFPRLFDASGADVYLTGNVQDQISSPEHNAKYDPTPDAPGPEPRDTSIADFFHTSEGALDYGWSYQADAPAAFTGYAQSRGYRFRSSYEWWSLFSWEELSREIDAGRPMMFLVDSDGDGGSDHFVPVFGYEDRGLTGLWYGFYANWDEGEAIQWERFRPVATSAPWGVSYATFVSPEDLVNTPEPASISLVMAGLAGLWMRRRVRCVRP
jgi:hypothetical protein